MARIITFGEIMLRLATPGHLRFSQTHEFEATFGGGEANVAVSLANYGDDAQFVTALPGNDIAKTCLAELRGLGVGVEFCIESGDRIGIYYIEKGAVARPSKVIYDRAHSSIAEIKPGMIDWDKVFGNADWFHWTGITSEIMPALVAGCDVIIGNEEDAEKVFGIKPDGFNAEDGVIETAKFQFVAKSLMERFPKASKVAITLRGSINADHNTWGAVLYDGKTLFSSRRYDITHIVDRVGGGDSFGGGLIHGLLSYNDDQKALDFAVAASCLKHTIEGDYNRVTANEVETLMNGNGSGRVSR